MVVLALLCVAAVAVVQSLFGVGVLLFGTPLLLLLGYSFVDALLFLLPVSLSINALQIAKHHAHIDTGFYKNIIVYAVPLIVVCLFIVTHIKINLAPLVGVFIIVVALKDYVSVVKEAIERLLQRERDYFLVMGAVHGLTNLGGALLSAAVHTKAYAKDMQRVTTAVSYMTFAVFQILTLQLSGRFQFGWVQMLFVTVAVGAFVMTERHVYTNLDSERYRDVFALFLLASGLLLVGKSL